MAASHIWVYVIKWARYLTEREQTDRWDRLSFLNPLKHTDGELMDEKTETTAT